MILVPAPQFDILDGIPDFIRFLRDHHHSRSASARVEIPQHQEFIDGLDVPDVSDNVSVQIEIQTRPQMPVPGGKKFEFGPPAP